MHAGAQQERRRRVAGVVEAHVANLRLGKERLPGRPVGLINAALDLHGDDPEFGYRLLTDELRLKGFAASENRVWRLCSQQQIFSVHSRKRGLNRKPGPPVHDDLLERDFTAETINTKWLTDITEHPTGEGKLYLCAIKDCASNKIVGYSLDARMTSELAVTALRNAIALRAPDGTIVHSVALSV